MTSAQAGRCVAESGAHTAALVELYTSKNCGSCRPAEQWLSSLRAHAPGTVLPVVLHVNARDYSGEPRPTRQRKLTPLQRMALTYTPQVLLQGREFRGWGTPAFDAALAQINRSSARVRIRLEIVSLRADGIEAEANALLSGRIEAAALYLAAYVKQSESHLVLEWQGPFAFGPEAPVRRVLPFPPGTAPANSGVVGFVQDRQTAEVLQALRLPAC